MNKKDSLFLLLGPEVGEKDTFISGLIERITEETGGQPEIHRFYPFDTELIDVLTILQNHTLFANYRVVILNNVEEISSSRDIRLLTEYCANPVSGASFLLLSNEIQKINKRLEKLIPRENIRIFWELFQNQKMGWIVNFFKKKEIGIDTQAANFLLDMVENNTRELKNICEKLALYYGDRDRIGYEDIEKVIYHSKEENVFTLFEKILTREFDTTLEVLQKILLSREAEPVRLLAGLLYQFRRFMALKSLTLDNYPLEEAFNRLGVRSKKLKKMYHEGLNNYSMPELKKIIMLTSEFDRMLRSLKSPLHPLIIQLFLYYAVVRGRWRD